MNILTWFMFGAIFILVFGIVENSGQTAINNINEQFAKISCPIPLYNMVDFGNGTIINSEINKNTGKNFGSTYQCFYDPHSVPAGTHMTISYVAFNATTFNAFPNGWFDYIGNVLGAIYTKVASIVQLALYFLTPINLNILGYTLSNIGGIGLLFVLAVYITAYLGVGLGFYTIVLGSIGKVL